MAKIKILHIITSLTASGVSTLLYSYYTKMDRKSIHFDFVAIPSDVPHIYKDKFEELGSNVYYMPKSYWKRIMFLYRLIKSGNYDIVHSHIELASAIYLLIAFFAGVHIRIAHAHMAFRNYDKKISTRLLKRFLNIVSTDKMGCSKDANISLFGSKTGKNITVLHNAIDIDKFRFCKETRAHYRKELGLEDKEIIGYIGRLSYEKNIFYMLSIFEAYHRNNANAILLVVGSGNLKEDFKKEVEKRQLTPYVIMAGSRTDIPQLMKAMDCLLLPSLSEGLGIVLIEAQAAALRCFTSKYTVPYEDTNISQYIYYLDINDSPNVWANKIETVGLKYNRVSIKKLLQDNHYDINIEANRLLEFYKNK